MSTTKEKSTEKPSVERSVKPYVAIIERLRELSRSRTANYRETARLLTELSQNQDWLDKLTAELGLDVLDPSVVLRALDEFLPDCEFSASDLVQIYRYFPTAEDWEGRRIVDLFDEAREQAARPSPNEPNRTRRTATLEQLAVLERQKEAARSQASTAKQESESLRAGATDQELRIKTLQHELSAAQEQIVELEAEVAALKERLLEIATAECVA